MTYRTNKEYQCDLDFLFQMATISSCNGCKSKCDECVLKQAYERLHEVNIEEKGGKG